MKPAAKISCLTDFPHLIDEVTQWLIDEWPDPSLTFSVRRSRLLDPAYCPPTLLAVIDGRPVAVAGFRRFRRKDDEHLSLFIDALYVHATVRRVGIGSALLEAAVMAAVPFENELFVYTELPGWYQDRGWAVLESGPGERGFVLRRDVVP